jgi:hypothetical protein
MVATVPGTPEAEAAQMAVRDALETYFARARVLLAELGRHQAVKVVYEPSPDSKRRRGAFHIVTEDALVSGHLKRQPGEALCRPRPIRDGRDRPEAPPGCLSCLVRAEYLLVRFGS